MADRLIGSEVAASNRRSAFDILGVGRSSEHIKDIARRYRLRRRCS
jgi:hypothetical protein